MNDAVQVAAATPARTEAFDVLIVGAGISGVGGAYHLTQQCPGTSFVVLETQESFGGTWIDAQISGHPLGQRPLHLRLSLQAVDQRADRDGRGDPELHGRGDRRERPRPHIRYRHRIDVARAGRAQTNLWTIDATRTDTGEPVRFTANFLWMCQGYYRHSEGYTPQWDGMETFKGRIVHPQTWPDDLDYTGKNVVVIGSGATAATLIPAMARRRRPRHYAAALADLFPYRPQRGRDRRRVAGAGTLTRRGSTRSYAARSCTTSRCSPAARSPSRRR